MNDFFSGYPFGLNIALAGYSGSSTIYDFPLFLELNASIDGFSYEQFASPYGHDLRFLSADASEELIYEVVDWNPAVPLHFLGLNSGVKFNYLDTSSLGQFQSGYAPLLL